MEQDLPVGPVKLKSGKGKDLRTAKLTCHPLWTIWLDEDVEHQSFPRAPQLLVSVAQLRQATRSTGMYVSCCVRGPPNPVSCELVQRSKYTLYVPLLVLVTHLGCKEQQS